MEADNNNIIFFFSIYNNGNNRKIITTHIIKYTLFSLKMSLDQRRLNFS